MQEEHIGVLGIRWKPLFFPVSPERALFGEWGFNWGPTEKKLTVDFGFRYSFSIHGMGCYARI